MKKYCNKGGAELWVDSAPILEKDGFYFKDLARAGVLLPYEDWRLPPVERAKDLAARLSVEEMVGLMMYSPHQMVPAEENSPFPGTYEGKPYSESGANAWDMTDAQKRFLKEDHIRHVLVHGLKDTETAAKWNNTMQAYAEKLPFGIPVNFSSDPRNGAASAGAEYKTGNGQISKWPEGLAMAATFDPEVCREFAQTAQREYRALGITTALSPQVDVGTEPRWMRVEDTYGQHPQLVADMGRAYCDGFQTDSESGDGWGKHSVATMAKHWPGGGPCEAGRDAHYPFGKFAVHPGGCEAAHTEPFKDGVFRLDGPTQKTSAVMPYYSVTLSMQDPAEMVGNSYSHHIIHDLLREEYGFDGIVCTDWDITGNPSAEIDSFGSRSYGAENLTEAERHLRILENGVDQFGGNSKIEPILQAYALGCQKYGEEEMHSRFVRSAVRLLTNMFRCGLFENPYVDVEESRSIVGSEEKCRAGFSAQIRSVVMIKNAQAMPIAEKKRVYVPRRFIQSRKNFFRGTQPPQDLPGADAAVLAKFYDVVEKPEDADFSVVFIESPLTDGGYTQEQGYLPITLQYRPYTATAARLQSIGQGDFRELEHPNRSYYGKTVTPANEKDLDIVLETKKKMGDKPVIVVVRMHNPCVLKELEPYADGILVDFGVQTEAILTLISGKAEPSGLLPVALPASMETVERHCEDKPFDYAPYVDTQGNAYDFAFGLNWSGKIQDARTEKYHTVGNAYESGK